MRRRHWLVLACVLALVACQPACTSTVAPKAVEARQASFSVQTGAQDSDIIGLSYNSAGDADGFVVTSDGRDRYNALIELYGSKWTPALEKDYGIEELSDGNWRFSAAAMVCWRAMADLARKGAK